MDRCTGNRNMTEILLKMELNTLIIKIYGHINSRSLVKTLRGKGEIARNIWGTICQFHKNLQTLSVWKSEKFVVWEGVKSYVTTFFVDNFENSIALWGFWDLSLNTNSKNLFPEGNENPGIIPDFEGIFGSFSPFLDDKIFSLFWIKGFTNNISNLV